MIVEPKAIRLPNGKSAVLRSAVPEDAEMLLRYMRITTSETPFLLRNPGEIRMTSEDEKRFLERIMGSPRELMLLAEIDGAHAGNASLSSLGSLERCMHRCRLAVALYKDYWGLGLGHAMLVDLLEAARRIGYEQAELQVCTENKRAIALYQKLGFSICGTLPHSMKYPDGQYADEYTMIRYLNV